MEKVTTGKDETFTICFQALFRKQTKQKIQNQCNVTTTLAMLKNTILLYHNFIFVLHIHFTLWLFVISLICLLSVLMGCWLLRLTVNILAFSKGLFFVFFLRLTVFFPITVNRS